jgi:hypothetical protein
MPTGPSGLEGLPEPAELHARLGAHRHLDWGDPIPSKQEIAAEFGDSATMRGLAMLRRAAAVERLLTDDFLAAVRPGTVSHQLQSRMKSPQSLARKLRRSEDFYRHANQPPEDIIRYTVVTPEPDDLIETAAETLDQLIAKNWTMDSALHSYVDGSRYKGLHTFLCKEDELIELQIHSQQSIEVKVRTTPLYEVERDPRQEREVRDAARATAIALSDQMTQPAGIDELSELGGVAVTTRSYGKRRRTQAERPTTESGPQGKAVTAQHRYPDRERQDGINR